ncbi:hypothetical protein COLO4_38138 [Corchorus olitorius]|uniref:Uncharacterized protein n=1 Tax=Corchorus olitorius TaxID=93759 RepID=A0A1R3FWS6_9ROSI|nr:hypothetical protein COLO4_38138 [Corchorus olitorius]
MFSSFDRLRGEEKITAELRIEEGEQKGEGSAAAWIASLFVAKSVVRQGDRLDLRQIGRVEREKW